MTTPRCALVRHMRFRTIPARCVPRVDSSPGIGCIPPFPMQWSNPVFDPIAPFPCDRSSARSPAWASRRPRSSSRRRPRFSRRVPASPRVRRPRRRSRRRAALLHSSRCKLESVSSDDVQSPGQCWRVRYAWNGGRCLSARKRKPCCTSPIVWHMLLPDDGVNGCKHATTCAHFAGPVS